MKRSRHPQARRRDDNDGGAQLRAMPPKRDGEHRWIAVALHTLTEGQARASLVGGSPPLERSALVSVSVCCADCDSELAAAADRPCTAAEVHEGAS